MIDKNKILCILNAKLLDREQRASEAYKLLHINNAVADELRNIIEDVQEQNEPDAFSIKDILSMMKQYCELWYKDGVPDCKTCFFYNKDANCMMDRIRENIEAKDKGK